MVPQQRCKLCRKSVLTDYELHLRTFHKVSASAMQEMLGGRYDLGGHQNEAFERWMRGSCLYRCSICGEEFGDSLDFSRHLERSHDTTLDEMRAGHGGDDRHVVRMAFTECDLCQWRIPHDGTKLRRHFRRYHPLVKMRDYFADYVSADSGSASPDDGFHDDAIEASRRKKEASRDTDSTSGISDLSDDDYDDEEGGDEDGVLGRVRQFSSFSHLFEEGGGGGCAFECEICGEATSATSAAEVHRHTTSRHDGLGILQYSQIFHSGQWYEGSLYKCFLCDDFLDTSNDRLRRHLQGVDFKISW